MKTFYYILGLIVISINAFAQPCSSAWKGTSFYAFPSFFSLYTQGKCISRPMGDTTICVKYRQILASQQAYFSYSSPTGEPAYVTSVYQYNKDCIMISHGTQIAPGVDTITICYTISAALIDNFCPYALITSPLAVEWCGIECSFNQSMLTVNWKTCSNVNTDRYEVIVSQDAQSWIKVGSTSPHLQYNSTESSYSVTFPYQNPGMNYVAIREIDLNGEVSVSEICNFECPQSTNSQSGFDLLGRVGASHDYMWYVRKP